MALLPSVTVIEGLVRDGWTYEMIAEEYDAKPNSVWRKLQRAGKVGHKPTGDDFLPWKVNPKHYTASIYISLLALQRMKEGREVNHTTKARAQRFYKNIVERNLVVDYDERVKPNQVSQLGGFYLRERRPGDQEYLPPMPEESHDE